MKKFLRILDVTASVVAALGAVAKIRKDIRTHREQGEHDPCDCPEHCLACLR